VNDDAAATDIDTAVVINVLANDATPESGETLNVAIGTPPVNGTVTVLGSQNVLFIPDPGFVGHDEFTYRVNDGAGNSPFVTVFVTVTPVVISATFGEDDAPGGDIVDLMSRTSSLPFPPQSLVDFNHRTGNDVGITFDAINETLIVDQSQYNYLAGGETEVITYTYSVADNNGFVVPRAATITIMGANDAPAITADNPSTIENQEISIDVLANDSDPDLSDSLTVRLGSTEPLNGRVELKSDGTIRYIPNLGYISPLVSGTRVPDEFTYFVTDGVVDSAEVTVSVTVHPINAAPTVLQPLDVTVLESDPQLILNLLQQAIDPDGSPLQVTDLRLRSGDDRGVTFNAAANSLVLNPPAYDQLGLGTQEVVIFDFNLSDGNGNFTPRDAILRIDGEDDQHLAIDDSVTTREDVPVDIEVLANDSPQETGEVLTVALGLVAPVNGTVVVNPDNTITYTPNLDFVGTDSFSYIGTGGVLPSVEALVTINVTPVNDAPRSIGPVDATFAEDVGQPSLLPYQVFEDTVRLFGFSVDDAGPLATFGGYSPDDGLLNLPGSNTGVYGQRPEDGFPAQDPKSVAASRGAENAFAGVFIDDVVIGFAERGEFVLDATIGEQGLADNPLFEAAILPGGDPREEVDFGEYQLEIRQSADYGVTGSGFPTDHLLFTTFDTNTPHAQQIALRFASATSGLPITGADIGDGVFVSLSDGAQTVELEFEDISNPAVSTGVTSGRIAVQFNNRMTSADLANALRDAINSSVVQGFLNVNASSLDGVTAFGQGTSDTVLLHGPAAADLTGSLQFSSDASRFPLQAIQFGSEVPGEEQGDQNRYRDQGQVILQNNTIVDSGSFGIIVDAGQRSRLDVSSLASTDLPRPGTPRAFVTPNPDSLVPGVVVMNNILAGNRSGGVLVSGDPSNLVSAPQPFARVINNTIYGMQSGDVGIRVEESASPTLLNNALSHLGTGILNTSGQNALEIFGSVYFNNAADTVGTGPGAFPLTPTTELFVDPDARNFYPTATSSLIDSAVGAVDDRAALESLRLSLGIASSPILAPVRDITGQRRSDTPGVNDGSGTGPTVFVDRGALDRSDSIGPIANLSDPLDLIAPIAPGFPELDSDILETYVRLEQGTKSQFVIQLDDLDSTGINDLSVVEETVVITENGRRLIPDVDYTFGYSATSNTIILTPSSGVWRPDAAYEITLNNRLRTVVRITDGVGVNDGDTFTVRDDVGSQATFEYDSGYVLQIAQTLAIDVIGDASTFIDREQFSITSPDGLTSVIFEFEKLGGVAGTSVPVDLSAAVSITDVRDAIFDALENGMVGTTPVKTILGISPQAVGAGRVQLGSQGGNVINAVQPSLSISGVDSGITDGDLFLYQSGGIVIQFEFDDGSLPTNLDPATSPANVIAFNATDTPDELAEKIGVAVANTALGLETARGLEGGRVYLGGQVGDSLDIQSGGLTLLGSPGVTGKLSLDIPAGQDGASVDGQQVTVTAGGTTQTFLLTTDSSVTTTDVIVLLSPADQADEIATNLANAIRSSFDGILLPVANQNSIDLGEPNLIQPSDRPIVTSLDLSQTVITLSTNVNNKRLLTVPAAATGTSVDGELVTITSAGVNQTFLLTTDPLATSLHTIVLLQAGDNASAIATKLSAAIATDFAGVLYPTSNGSVVTLGEPADFDPGTGPFNTTVDLSASVLTSTGFGGGAVAVPFIPTVAYTADTLAGQVIAAVTRSGLESTAFAPGGGTVWFDHTEFVIGPEAGLVNAISDVAGNDLAPNRPNRETQFTILMPDVQLDFGDAPSQYVTSLAENGPRHTVTPRQLPRLGDFVDTEVDAFADSDDQSSTLAVSSTGTSFNVISSGPGDVLVEVVSGSIAAGDLIQIQIDSVLTRSYQLIRAGSPTAANVGVIHVPGEPAEVLAERLASAITNDLRAIAPRASVVYENGTAVFSFLSVNDEDGVLIGADNSSTLDGVFLDEAGNVFGFLNPLAPQGSGLIVNTVGGGLLDVWIDYDGDGTFTDPGEQVLQNQPVLDGRNIVTIPQPETVGVLDADGVGQTWARFRLSNTGNLLPNGLAIGGEIEDHEITIISASLPVPGNDGYTLVEGNDLSQLANGVAVNDDLAGLNPGDLTFVVERQPSNGTLTFNADGTFVYQPDPDFYGDDFFTYHIEAVQTVGSLVIPTRSTPATVTMFVAPFNEVPFAVNKDFVTNEWADGTGSVLTITSADLLAGALPQDDAADRLPPWNEEEQTLSIVQIDVFDATGTRQPVVTMADPLTPVDGVYRANTHADLGGGVFIPSGSLQVTVAGSVVTMVEYQPTTPFGPTGSGEYNEDNSRNADTTPSRDQFIFTVADDGATTLPNGDLAVPQPAGKLTEAMAFIQVLPTNDAPEASDDMLVGAIEDTDFNIALSDLVANDMAGPVGAVDENTGVNDGAVTVVTTVLPSGLAAFPQVTPQGGIVRLQAGNLVYTPAADYYGLDSFQYTITDQGVTPKFDTATVVLNVSPSNDAPSAFPASFITLERVPVTISAADLIQGSMGDAMPQQPFPQSEANQSVRVSALDVNGTSVTTTSGPHFTADGNQIDAVFDASGLVSVTYTPLNSFNSDNPDNAGSRRMDTFVFTITDNGESIPALGGPAVTISEASSTATASILVAPQNDPPVANTDTAGGPEWNNYFNGLGQTAPVPTEDLPLIIPRAFLLSNDSEGPAVALDESNGPNDGGLTINQQPITTTLGGSIRFLPSGDLEYTPPSDAFGVDTFEYTIADSGVQEDVQGDRSVEPRTATTMVTINLAPVNDAPQFDTPNSVTMPEDTLLRTVVLTGIDAGGGEVQVLEVTAVSNDTSLLANPVVAYTSNGNTGTLSLTPLPDQFGVTTVSVTLTDGGLDNDLSTAGDNLSVTQTFIVRVDPVNDTPEFNAASSLTIAEGSGPHVIDVTNIDAGGGESQLLRISAVSADPTLIQDPAPIYTSPDATGTLTFSPEAFQFGTTEITVIVEDAGLDGSFATLNDNQSAQSILTVTVTPVNDPPVLSPLVDRTVNEDSEPTGVQLTGIGAGPNETQNLRITATSSDPTLISDPTIDYTSPSGIGALTFQPNLDQFGTATITVSIEDGGDDNDLSTAGDNLISTQSFDVTVVPVNDLPMIGQPADLPILEDAGTQTVSLSGINAGGNESQPIRVTASSSDPSLIPTPVVNYNTPDSIGEVVFTPADNAFGTVTITLELTDGGDDGNLSTSFDNMVSTTTFDVIISPVNDDPTVDPVAALNAAEDADPQVISLTGITPGLGESDPLRVTAVSGNTALVSDLVVDYSTPDDTATVTYTPQPDQFGSTTITVTIEDGGLDGDLATAGDNGSTDLVIDVTIDPVNDLPTISDPLDLQLNEDSAQQTVALSGIGAGANESQALRVTATSDNQALIPDPAVNYTSPGSTGDLVFAPLADAFGVANITVTVEDGGDDDDLSTVADNLTFSETFAVTLVNLPDSPVANNDSLDTDEDNALTIRGSALLANDTDADLGPDSNEVLSIAMPAQTTSTLGATITFDQATGDLTYDPTTSSALRAMAPGETLQDSFTYGVTDADGETNPPTATVFLNVSGINDAPIVGDDIVAAPENFEPVVIRPLENDVDVDGTLDLNSIIITEDPVFGSVAKQINNGVLELAYSPFANFPGGDTFRYTISDNLGQQSAQALVVIEASSAPRAGSDITGGVATNGLNINVLANDFPVEGVLDVSTVTIVTPPQNGQAVPQADGTITYTSNSGFVGVDSFEYTVTDSVGNVSEPASVRVRAVDSGLENPLMFGDVNANGEVTALDALLIINQLSGSGGQASIPVDPADRGPNFFDVNGNMSITALDALLVINNIGSNAPIISAEGEMVSLSAEPVVASMAASYDTAVVDPVDSIDDVFDSIVPTESKLVDTAIDGLLTDDVVDLLAAVQDDSDDDEDANVNGTLADLAIQDLL
ncbi:MAG: Ig-like domain-containing protein, partial [Rubripirellula sp.]